MDTNQDKLQKLIEKREQAMAGGGAAAVEKHHAKGIIYRPDDYQKQKGNP